jgi:hypothetical protein
MNTPEPEVQCYYLRTTQLLNAKSVLSFPDSSKIRFFTSLEASKFADTMRRSNVVARLAGSRNFYLNRAAELSDRTVIEVLRVSSPDNMLEIGESVAILLEKLAVLSTTLFMRRDDLLRKLGISASMTSEVNFAVTSKFKRIRSRSQRAPAVEGVVIDRQFCDRFLRCGFIGLFQYLQSQGDLHKRVRTSADWLLESRREARLTASVVKTAIALESLLIFSESESLARTLSERSAFILSPSPQVRHEISRVILRFYDVRSGIVHGSQKKARKLTSTLTECVDRLTLLLHLIIASNTHLWANVESLRLWCEEQRWGKPSSDVKFPLSQIYLRNALALVADEMQKTSS